MSMGNTFENDLARLIFHGTPIPNIADNAASSPLTNLIVSLHTADPAEGGAQTTNEVAYTGYARVSVARGTGGWTVTDNVISPAANIDFAQPGAGTTSQTATHFAVGTAASGAGKVMFKGPLNPSIAIAAGAQAPRITTASTITLD